MHLSLVTSVVWAYNHRFDDSVPYGGPWASMGEFLCMDLALRGALSISLVIHEWSHLVAAALADPCACSETFTWTNIVGGLTLWQWADFLTPLRTVKVARALDGTCAEVIS